MFIQNFDAMKFLKPFPIRTSVKLGNNIIRGSHTFLSTSNNGIFERNTVGCSDLRNGTEALATCAVRIHIACEVLIKSD